MLQGTLETEVWDGWCAEAGVDDVCYSFRYLEIWARQEGARAQGLRFTSARGTVLYPVLVFSLDNLPEGAGWVDVRTPFGFGGPLALGNHPELALELFDEAFDEWIEVTGVVTELARLHPLRQRAVPGDAMAQADSYVVQLGSPYEDVAAGYEPGFRDGLSDARSHGLDAAVEEDPAPESVASFHGLHPELSRFSPETLRSLGALPEVSLHTVRHGSRLVAAAYALRSGRDLFYLLGASEEKAPERCPEHLLFDAMIRWGRETGCKILHLGGGGEERRRFQAGFANATVPCFELRRIHRPEVYHRLCRGVPAGEALFPPYRRLSFAG